MCVGLTPTAAEWIAERIPALEELTGHPVRHRQRQLGTRSVWPPPTVSVIAPATLNTVNTVALGLTPTWLAGHAVEAMGMRWPLVVMPCVNSAYGTHPQFARSVETLRAAGVRVLLGEPDGFVPPPPGEGDARGFPWDRLTAAVREVEPSP